MLSEMNSNENLFEDIEQDNNPSFYGGRNSLEGSFQKLHEENEQQNIINTSLVLSNKIKQLINNPELKIDIISTGRIPNTSIIVYSIELSAPNEKPIVVKRRYSEFSSLRDNLQLLFPTLIISPVPEKHSIFSYLVNSINNSNEISIIESRRRYFKIFLNDLILDSDPRIKNCVLLHKFLDPNYENNWMNALNEPPVNLLPKNLLLANPLDPTDQNGLYTLLPMVNGFDFKSGSDNFASLKKLSDDIVALNKEIEVFEMHKPKAEETQKPSELFTNVPKELIEFEVSFNRIIKTMHDLNKLSSHACKDYKAIINTFVELGGNLNYFSLQIYEANSNEISLFIEKFGSTADSNFLNFESFLFNGFIPNWQEPIHQLAQYYLSTLQLIKFYKYKIIQFKLLHKLKFNKYKELSNFNSHDPQLSLNSLGDLEVNSPSINRALNNMKKSSMHKSKGGLSKKTSWYGLFGGSKQLQFHSAPLEPPPTNQDDGAQFKYNISNIEKDLNKLDQLITLMNLDMILLSNALTENFKEFLIKMERKWLLIMLDFIRNIRIFFTENLNSWLEFKDVLTSNRI